MPGASPSAGQALSPLAWYVLFNPHLPQSHYFIGPSWKDPFVFPVTKICCLVEVLLLADVFPPNASHF